MNRMCTPLLGSTNGKVFRFKNDGNKVSRDWIKESVDEIAAQFEPLFAQMDKAAATKIDNVDEVMGELVHLVPGHMRDEVTNAYQEEPTPTVWGLANAFSRAASHTDGVGFNHRMQAERAAGWYVTVPDHCTACGRPMDGHVH
jgi:hypothetical protein